jgi:hypothetical protein
MATLRNSSCRCDQRDRIIRSEMGVSKSKSSDNVLHGHPHVIRELSHDSLIRNTAFHQFRSAYSKQLNEGFDRGCDWWNLQEQYIEQ